MHLRRSNHKRNRGKSLVCSHSDEAVSRARCSNESAITTNNLRKGPVQFCNSERRIRRENEGVAPKSSSLRYLCRGANDSAWNTRRERHLLAPSWHTDASFCGDIEEIHITYGRNTGGPVLLCQSSFPLTLPLVLAVCSGLWSTAIFSSVSAVLHAKKFPDYNRISRYEEI